MQQIAVALVLPVVQAFAQPLAPLLAQQASALHWISHCKSIIFTLTLVQQPLHWQSANPESRPISQKQVRVVLRLEMLEAKRSQKL